MGIIDVLFAIILGIVEGFTEWLPISSTAHLIIVEELFSPFIQGSEVYSGEFLLLLDVIVQLGAITSCVIIYFKRLYPFGKNQTKEIKKEKFIILKNIINSLIPIVILGLLLDNIVVELFYNLFTIIVMLIGYGLLMIFLDNYNFRRQKITNVCDISKKKAFTIGLVQTLAIIPGTSRSGVTITSAGLLGVERRVAVEYSFFLAIPIMFGASLLKGIKYMTNYTITQNEIIILLIASLTALLVSLIVIKTLMRLIKEINFKLFGLYRIGLGIILLVTMY